MLIKVLCYEEINSNYYKMVSKLNVRKNSRDLRLITPGQEK